MKRLKIEEKEMTFEEACEKYIHNCCIRNLREATINHYLQSYEQFYKFFPRDMPLSQMKKSKFDEYVLFLKGKSINDVTINTYLRDLITTLHFLMEEGDLSEFKMNSIKADKSDVETYSEEELEVLLKKPNIKKCSFLEYQGWVVTNFLFSTGVRQRSLINIKIKDIDLNNAVVTIRVTKNRRVLVIPLTYTMVNILKDFLKHRQHESNEDWLFCNAYGQQLTKSTCYRILSEYNKRRGVEKTGIHRYRHTFSKQWILCGGNVVSLSKMLGHSNLSITQNYINLLVSDLSEQVNDINLLEKFSGKKRIKM